MSSRTTPSQPSPNRAQRRRRARRPRAGRRDGRARRQGARRRLRRRRTAAAARRDAAASTGAASSSRSEGVNECVAKGLAVIQGDADTDLADYPDDAFDYVILSQTCRRRAIRAWCSSTCCASAGAPWCRFRISATGRCGCSLLFAGHMPQTDILPYSWYDTPNIHHCTIKDFRQLCAGDRREDGERGGAQCLGHAAAAQCAVVVLEPVRRAGRVSAQPQGLNARGGPCRNCCIAILTLPHRANNLCVKLFDLSYSVVIRSDEVYIKYLWLYNFFAISSNQ